MEKNAFIDRAYAIIDQMNKGNDEEAIVLYEDLQEPEEYSDLIGTIYIDLGHFVHRHPFSTADEITPLLEKLRGA